MTEDLKYYEIRLKFIRETFRQEGIDLLNKNKDKIRSLVQGYNRFKNHENYNLILAEFPETFILKN